MTTYFETEQHINNLIYVLNQLRAGANAKRFGHVMSTDDVIQYMSARDIVVRVVDLTHTDGDDDLIPAMEQHIATLKGEQHAEP